MKKQLSLCFLMLYLFFILLIPLSAVQAVATLPISITIEYAKAFENVHEMGDMLFMCRYNIVYEAIPAELASELFILALTNSSTGAVIVHNRVPEDGYGNNIQTLYLSAAEVTAKGVSWEGTSYNLSVMTNPTVFIEFLQSSKFMDSTSWINAIDVATGKVNLATAIISQSRALELIDTSLLLTTDTASGRKLSSTGVSFWIDRYGALGELDISAVSAKYMTVDNQTYTGSYLTDLGLIANATSMKENFANLGDTIGIPYWQVIAFGVLCIPTFMIISGTVYSVSGNSKLAAILAAPMMFVITMLVPDALLMILTAIMAFIVVSVMWRFV